MSPNNNRTGEVNFQEQEETEVIEDIEEKVELKRDALFFINNKLPFSSRNKISHPIVKMRIRTHIRK